MMTGLILLSMTLGLAVSARADISDSGNLTIGGQAMIVGSMTVTGPIAGSSITLSTTGAQVYALTTSTGIHILNGRLKLEVGSYIEWPDGKTSTTSATAASSTQNSTYTYLQNEYTDGVAPMGPCISGSTITFTTSGNPVEIMFDFSQAHGASGGGTRVQVLMDGAWIDDFGPSESMAPMSRDPGASSTVWFPTYLRYRTNTAPSAGTHSFCITFERTGGGVSYITCKKAGTAEGPKKCLFMARELK